MSKPAFYDSILYQIEYQPQLSNEEAKLTYSEIACEYESYLLDLMD